MTSLLEEQRNRVASGSGFIAALDQSGGSTPKALATYGVTADAWSSEDEMFDLVHAMRSRIMTSPSFTGERVLGAILFEQTMDRQVDGLATADYLWQRKNVVPFVKCDAGLADEVNGAQVMRDNPGLDALLDRAVEARVFGTKMRSVINSANADGVNAVVAQQFEIGKRILAKGLMPIIEPEVTITAPDKPEIEALVLDAIGQQLADLGDQQVMLKLSLPDTADHYAPLIESPNVLRVVALSGGYDLDESCRRLSENHGMIASFSRVLTTGLSADQEQAGFDTALDATINQISEASAT